MAGVKCCEEFCLGSLGQNWETKKIGWMGYKGSTFICKGIHYEDGVADYHIGYSMERGGILEIHPPFIYHGLDSQADSGNYRSIYHLEGYLAVY